MVFSSECDRGAGRNDLYRLWFAAGAVERLTHYFEGYAIMPSVSTKMTWPFEATAPGCWPSWSPDGQSIAHVFTGAEPSSIQVVSSFGTSPTPVPGESSARWHYYPDWSPDGRLLAVSVSPEHHAGENWDLAITDPSRAMPFQKLTTGAGNDRLPDWRPH